MIKDRNAVQVYCDAAYGNARNNRSQSGFICMMNDGPVSWQSVTQKLVATSAQEAEIIAVACLFVPIKMKVFSTVQCFFLDLD